MLPDVEPEEVIANELTNLQREYTYRALSERDFSDGPPNDQTRAERIVAALREAGFEIVPGRRMI